MAAPQTGLTSSQIGDMGHPRTVPGNPRHIPAGGYTCYYCCVPSPALIVVATS